MIDVVSRFFQLVLYMYDYNDKNTVGKHLFFLFKVYYILSIPEQFACRPYIYIYIMLKFSMPEKLEQENPDHKLEIRPENPDLLGHGGRISTFLCMKS